MLITHKFRLYPGRKEEARLLETKELCRQMYNKLLFELNEQKVIDKSMIQGTIPEIKICEPRFKRVHSKTLQYENYRLFSNLSALAKTKGKRKVGRLRYKGKGWFKSFTYNQTGFKLIKDNTKLHLSKIGDIKIKCHRHILGKIKQIIIKREASGKWYANLCEERKVTIPKKTKISKVVGIDVGLIDLTFDSDNTNIPNPRILKSQEAKLKKLHRQLSKKKKGSLNRYKSKQKLAVAYEKLGRCRIDRDHKISRYYVDNYDAIGMEDLVVSNMVQNKHLSKSISDVSWGRLRQFITYKAENAGKYAVTVNSRGTSQRCSNCGITVPKGLHQRQHQCSNCGLDINRDYNSALEIRKLTINKLRQELPEVTLVEIPLSGNQNVFDSRYVSMKQEATSLNFGETKC